LLLPLLLLVLPHSKRELKPAEVNQKAAMRALVTNPNPVTDCSAAAAAAACSATQ
jgi:hypothetical protein